MTDKTISRARVSPGSADTWVSRGAVINHRLFLLCCCLFCGVINDDDDDDSILSQQHLCQNYQNRLISVKAIGATSVSFFETQCTCSCYQMKSTVVVLETQVLVLVLVLDSKVLILVLVLVSQVLVLVLVLMTKVLVNISELDVVILSVSLSVTCMLCDKPNKLRIFWYHTKWQSL